MGQGTELFRWRDKKITPTGYQPIRVNQERVNKIMENSYAMSRESGGARTHDPRLKRPLLYQLSYRFNKSFKTPKIRSSSPENQTKSDNFLKLSITGKLY
jgi:hypothetical protein